MNSEPETRENELHGMRLYFVLMVGAVILIVVNAFGIYSELVVGSGVVTTEYLVASALIILSSVFAFITFLMKMY